MKSPNKTKKPAWNLFVTRQHLINMTSKRFLAFEDNLFVQNAWYHTCKNLDFRSKDTINKISHNVLQVTSSFFLFSELRLAKKFTFSEDWNWRHIKWENTKVGNVFHDIMWLLKNRKCEMKSPSLKSESIQKHNIEQSSLVGFMSCEIFYFFFVVTAWVGKNYNFSGIQN